MQALEIKWKKIPFGSILLRHQIKIFVRKFLPIRQSKNIGLLYWLCFKIVLRNWKSTNCNQIVLLIIFWKSTDSFGIFDGFSFVILPKMFLWRIIHLLDVHAFCVYFAVSNLPKRVFSWFVHLYSSVRFPECPIVHTCRCIGYMYNVHRLQTAENCEY